MADLTAANVTVTLTQDDIDRSPDRVGLRTYPSISFGNGVLKYPALGIPMPDIGKFGMNFALKRAYIEPPANGYIYHFDRANHKLRIFQVAGHAHDLLVKGGAAGGIDEPIGVEGTDTLAKDAAADRTIAGADSATKGGVIALAAGALVELGNVAVPATVLNLEMVGR